MSDLEQAMNYDLAIDIINLMKAMASKKKKKASTDEEFAEINDEINMYYCYEEGVINGRYGDEMERRSLYDKVFNMYSPLIRKIYGTQ